MKVIGIECYGYRDLERKFNMLKEIFTILKIYHYTFKRNTEIIVDEKIKYKFLNYRDPLIESKIRVLKLDKIIDSAEIEDEYDNLKKKIYKMIN